MQRCSQLHTTAVPGNADDSKPHNLHRTGWVDCACALAVSRHCCLLLTWLWLALALVPLHLLWAGLLRP